MPLSLCTADVFGLVLRQHLRMEFVHADLLRDSLSGLAVVARHHHDTADTAGMQRIHGILRLGAERIENAHHGSQSAGNAEIQVRIFRRQRIKFLLLSLRNDAFFILKGEMRTSDDDLLAFHGAGNTMGDNILHARMILLV